MKDVVTKRMVVPPTAYIPPDCRKRMVAKGEVNRGDEIMLALRQQLLATD